MDCRLSGCLAGSAASAWLVVEARQVVRLAAIRAEPVPFLRAFADVEADAAEVEGLRTAVAHQEMFDGDDLGALEVEPLEPIVGAIQFQTRDNCLRHGAARAAGLGPRN